MTREEIIALARAEGCVSAQFWPKNFTGLMGVFERFAALAEAKERERWSEVERYLVAAAAGSMSRNNSEQIASELLEQIHDTSRTR